MASAKNFLQSENGPNFQQVHKKLIKRGDIVGVQGHPMRTGKGELSIAPGQITLLAPCLIMMPTQHFGVSDQQTRYRQRYLDLIFNKRTRKIFKVRAKIISEIRQFLDNR